MSCVFLVCVFNHINFTVIFSIGCKYRRNDVRKLIFNPWISSRFFYLQPLCAAMCVCVRVLYYISCEKKFNSDTDFNFNQPHPAYTLALTETPTQLLDYSHSYRHSSSINKRKCHYFRRSGYFLLNFHHFPRILTFFLHLAFLM